MKNKRYVYWSGTIHCFCASQRTYLITGGKCVARLVRSQGLWSTVDFVGIKKHSSDFFHLSLEFLFLCSSIPQKNVTLNTSRSTTLLFLLRGIFRFLENNAIHDYEDTFVVIGYWVLWSENVLIPKRFEYYVRIAVELQRGSGKLKGVFNL